MRRAFYERPVPQQQAFRRAVARHRGWAPSRPEDRAWLQLGVTEQEVDRTHTLDLYDRVADRLALTPEADRASIEVALFGGPSS